MANNGKIATVFGATGFQGRYVVEALASNGVQVVCPFRGTDMEARHLRMLGDHGRVAPLQYDPRDADSVRRCVRDSDIVINLIGKYYETKAIRPWKTNWSMEDIHTKMPFYLGTIAKEAGVRQFIHFSALDAHVEGPSEFSKSKGLGEIELRKAFPEAVVVRPGLTYGHEDRLLCWMANWLTNKGPVMLPEEGAAMWQPIAVGDISRAISILVRDDYMHCDVNLAGDQVYTHKEMAEYVFAMIRADPKMLDLPLSSMMLLARAMQFTLNSPLTTPDEVLRLAQDITLETAPVSATVPTHTLEDLGVKSTNMETAAYEFLYRFRTGGHFHASDRDWQETAGGSVHTDRTYHSSV